MPDHSCVRCLDWIVQCKALFSSKIFGKISIIALLFVFNKYCPIID